MASKVNGRAKLQEGQASSSCKDMSRHHGGHLSLELAFAIALALALAQFLRSLTSGHQPRVVVDQ